MKLKQVLDKQYGQDKMHNLTKMTAICTNFIAGVDTPSHLIMRVIAQKIQLIHQIRWYEKSCPSLFLL